MGVKGRKLTHNSIQMAELLQKKLAVIDGISTKKMFGGRGIFKHQKMFGIVDSNGQVYFKVNDYNAADFTNSEAHRHGKMLYFSIPDKVSNDHRAMLALANKTLKTIR